VVLDRSCRSLPMRNSQPDPVGKVALSPRQVSQSDRQRSRRSSVADQPNTSATTTDNPWQPDEPPESSHPNSAGQSSTAIEDAQQMAAPAVTGSNPTTRFPGHKAVEQTQTTSRHSVGSIIMWSSTKWAIRSNPTHHPDDSASPHPDTTHRELPVARVRRFNPCRTARSLEAPTAYSPDLLLNQPIPCPLEGDVETEFSPVQEESFSRVLSI
jgi:hypothetical protein